MEELDLLNLKKRALTGIVSLATGTLLLQAITLLSQFTLSVLLPPSAFGIFSILTAAVAILVYFSDIGLAAALIQKKETLTQDDLATTFTIQQTLVITLVVLGFIATPFVSNFYHLDDAGLWLLRALLLSFFLASLKTIPTILLERSIRFGMLTIVTILEAVAFYGVIIFFASKGYGVQSFTYGVLTRGIIGLIAMYCISPWMPHIRFHKEVSKRLLSFGLPIQANSIIALVKDQGFLLYLGKALTHDQVGYYGWAKSWSEAPLRLIMDAISRVMFPVYSRLQDNKRELANLVEKTLFFQSALIFPASIGFAFLISPLVHMIPKYTKWEPAIPLFYYFVATSVLASIAAPLTHVLNATGQVKKTLMLMVLWTILTWTVTPFMIMQYGYQGAAIGSFVVGLTNLITFFFVKQTVPFSLKKAFLSPIVASLLLGAVLYGITPFLATSWAGVLGILGISVLVYGAIMYILEYQNLKSDVSFLRTLRKS